MPEKRDAKWARRPIATRQFRSSAGEEVTAHLYKPVFIDIEQWRCDFRIVGLPKKIEAYAIGIDSLQALTIAIEGLRVNLERVGQSLTWFDGEPGDHGLPRRLPPGYGREVEERLAKLVGDEVDRLMEAKKRKLRQK